MRSLRFAMMSDRRKTRCSTCFDELYDAPNAAGGGSRCSGFLMRPARSQTKWKPILTSRSRIVRTSASVYMMSSRSSRSSTKIGR
jgi:hypothetical protein